MTYLDILSDESYTEKHIKGAVNICVYETAFPDKVKEQFPDKSAEIIVYGFSDATIEAQQAKDILTELGYTKVSILAGGLAQWESDGKALEGTLEEKHITGAYTLDTEKSIVNWAGRNIANRHHGTVGLQSGNIAFENGLPISGEIVLDLSKLICEDLTKETGHDMLIHHLQSDDFFSTEKFPTATLKFKNAERIDGPQSSPNAKITADLTIKGTTHEITVEAFVQMRDTLVIHTHFDIDRTKWNVQYGSEKFFAKLGAHIINDEISFDARLFSK